MRVLRVSPEDRQLARQQSAIDGPLQSRGLEVVQVRERDADAWRDPQYGDVMLVFGRDVLRRVSRSQVGGGGIAIVCVAATVLELADCLNDGAQDGVVFRSAAWPLVTDIEELVARLTARARLTNRSVDGRLSAGSLMVDTWTQQAYWAGKPVRLTSSQFGVLLQLAERTGWVVSKAMMFERAYGQRADGDLPEQKVIDVVMSHVRAALVRAGAPKDFIRTVWGRGYVIEKSAVVQKTAGNIDIAPAKEAAHAVG